jgi:hypothetical protein
LRGGSGEIGFWYRTGLLNGRPGPAGSTVTVVATGATGCGTRAAAAGTAVTMTADATITRTSTAHLPRR